MGYARTFHVVERNLAILQIRMDALKQAIDARNWDRAEFQYDRVLRSIQKMERNLYPGPKEAQ